MSFIFYPSPALPQASPWILRRSKEDKLTPSNRLFGFISSTISHAFRLFIPRSAHLWALRLAINLPGIDSTLMQAIRLYLGGRLVIKCDNDDLPIAYVASHPDLSRRSLSQSRTSSLSVQASSLNTEPIAPPDQLVLGPIEGNDDNIPFLNAGMEPNGLGNVLTNAAAASMDPAIVAYGLYDSAGVGNGNGNAMEVQPPTYTSYQNQLAANGNAIERLMRSTLTFRRKAYTVRGHIYYGDYNRIAYAEDEMGSVVAIKYLDKKNMFNLGRGKALLRQEVRIMQLVTNANLPCLVPLLASWDDLQHVYLVMPLYRGSLADAMKENCCPREPDLRIWFGQMSMGLAHLHDHDIVHRDLKPANVLIDDKGNLRVADFGASWQHRYPHQSIYDTPISGHYGTLGYTAPEIYAPQTNYTALVDIWSLGTIWFELEAQMRSCLFYSSANTDEENLQRTVSGAIPFDQITNSAAQTLLRGMLERDPSKRLNISGVIKSPYFLLFEWNNVDRKHDQLANSCVPSPPKILLDLRIKEGWRDLWPHHRNQIVDDEVHSDEVDGYYQYQCPPEREMQALQGSTIPTD